MDSSSCNYGSSTEISIDLEKPYVDVSPHTKIYNIALLVEAKRQLEAQIQTVDEKLLASLRHRRQLTITTESSNSFGFRAGEGAVLPTSGSRKGKEKIEYQYRPESNIDNKNKKLKRFPNNSDENHPQEAAEIKKARVTMMLDLTKDPNNRGPSQAAAAQPNAQSSLPPSVLNTLIKNVMVNPDFTAAIHAAIVNTLIKNVMVNPDFTAAIHAAIAAAVNGSAGPSNQQPANVSNSTSSN
ncbi:uncharacterized protein LOC141812274 [Curcuma longa]|uniref:uncharacterized protein LOC141812274 n=1 Tax=Curcuma longa TaxID=136217 RepID=UPI003D9F57A7